MLSRLEDMQVTLESGITGQLREAQVLPRDVHLHQVQSSLCTVAGVKPVTGKFDPDAMLIPLLPLCSTPGPRANISSLGTGMFFTILLNTTN